MIKDSLKTLTKSATSDLKHQENIVDTSSAEYLFLI